jgi:hypothetical protein
LLALDRMEAAIRIFEDGTARNPRPESRDYFRTALASARLRQREYEPAAALLAEIRAPALRIPVQLFQIHALGALGQREEALSAYDSLVEERAPIPAELMNELHRRFLTSQQAEHSEEWLDNQEIRYLLRAI